MKNGLSNATRVVVGSIVAALVLCAAAAWITGNAVVLLPGLALLPGLGYVLSTGKPGGRRP